MADVLRDFMTVGSAVGTAVLNTVAQKDAKIQTDLLAQKKIQAEQYINQKLTNPDYVNDPTKIQDDFKNEFDTSGLSEDSQKSLSSFVQSSTFSLQKKQQTQIIKATKVTAADDAVNTISTIRNSVTAGKYDPDHAISLYEQTVAPSLKQSLGSKYETYDKTVKSSFLLEGLKNSDPEAAAKMLNSDKYISGMTSSDYTLARHYIKSQHAETIANTNKAIALQVKIGKGIFDGTYTPEEVKKLQSQETGVASESIGRTAAAFQTIKKMNVNQIDNLLTTEKGLTPEMRQLLISRRDKMKTAVQSNLVGWAEQNDETKTLNFNNTESLKTSLHARIVDVNHLEQKYGVKAKNIFSPLEQKHLAFSFHNSSPQQKTQILQTLSTAITPSRYKDIDSTLYKGATADIEMIKNNPNAISILQDSMNGALKVKNTPALAVSQKNKNIISQTVSNIYGAIPQFVNTTTDQIANVMVAHGMGSGKDTISTSDVEGVMEEIAGGSIQKGAFNSSSSRAHFMSPDHATTSLIADRQWTPEIVNSIAESGSGKVSVKDFGTNSFGKQYTIDDMKKWGQFHTVGNGVYTCTITDPTGVQTVLRDKNNRVITFNTANLKKEDRARLSSFAHRTLWGTENIARYAAIKTGRAAMDVLSVPKDIVEGIYNKI